MAETNTGAVDIAALADLAALGALSEAELDAARGARDFQPGAENTGPLLEGAPDLPGAAELADQVSPEALNFIVTFEVSSRKRYERKYKSPVWPGGHSGVTLGFGYDLAHQTFEEIAEDWAALGPDAITLLQAAQGLRGDDARAHFRRAPTLKDLLVTWEQAMAVYRRASLPKYARMTAAAFPSSHDLHGHAFGALVSLVFNRGAGMRGDRRREMRAIQALCRERRYGEIPAQLRAMSRIWRGTRNAKGLIRRREAEAALFERGLTLSSCPIPPRQGVFFESAAAATYGGGGDTAQKDELAFELGLLIESAQREGVDPYAPGPSVLESMAEYQPAAETVLEAQSEGGFSGLLSFGFGVLEELEVKLKHYVCNDITLRDDFGDLSERLVLAARSEQAAAGGGQATEPDGAFDGGPALESAETVVDVLGGVIKTVIPILPRRFCDRIAQTLFDKVVEPLIGDSLAITQERICRAWTVGASPTDAEDSAEAAPDVGGLGPTTPASLSPAVGAPAAVPAPTSQNAVADALGRLRQAVEQNPHALDAAARAQLSALIGAEGRPGLSEIFDLMGKVEAAAATPDDAALEAVAGELRTALRRAPAPLPAARAKKTLKALRREKRFQSLSQLADAFITHDPALSGPLSSLYAQGLIDAGKLIAAYELLNAGRPHARGGDLHEALGLMGRVKKQIYVNHVQSTADAVTAPEHIRAALPLACRHYREATKTWSQNGDEIVGERTLADAHWPWINYIAMLVAAERDGVPVARGEDPIVQAKTLIAALIEADSADDEEAVWRLASLGEAYIAVGDFDRAAQAFAAYAKDARVTPFQIASTARQLEEVWRIRAGMSGAGAILANLKEAAARGADVRLSQRERADLLQGFQQGEEPEFSEMFLETRTGKGRTMLGFVIKKIAQACDAVCALQRVEGGRPRTYGTGFIVDGPALSDRLSADKSYVLTNAHVLWDASLGKQHKFRAPLTPDTAFLSFESHAFDGREETYRCARVLWQSDIHLCDATLIELDRKAPDVRPMDITRRPPVEGMGLAVIGHPLGGDLTVALPGQVGKQQARLVDVGPKPPAEDPIFLHYETTTEAGNSGSPVLDTDSWDVIALHHAGFGGRGLSRLDGEAGFNRANEGVSILSISDQIKTAMATRFESAEPKRGLAAMMAKRQEDPTPEALAPDLADEEIEPDEVIAAAARRPRLETASTAALWCPFASEGPSMRARGPYQHGYPIGAVVHYTAGRFAGGAEQATRVMRDSARKHWYFAIADDGTILQPGPLNQWGSHAGRSWAKGLEDDPDQDYHWLSQYLVGVEVLSAGWVTSRGDAHAPYWNPKFSPSDTLFGPDEVRYASGDAWSNVTMDSYYHRYTAAQEAALRRLLLWLYMNNPTVFRIDNILGHDEVAVRRQPGPPTLGRKQDPGGALSVSMATLREEIKTAQRACVISGDMDQWLR